MAEKPKKSDKLSEEKQSKEKQSKEKQSKVKHSKVKHSKVKQSKEKQSEEKLLLENKGWKGIPYRWAITYLVLSSINFIITIVSPIFWLSDSLFYIFAIVISIGLFSFVIYYFIKKNKIIKVLTLIFNIGGILAVLLVLDRWSIFLIVSLSFFELIAIFLTYFKIKGIQSLEIESSKIKKHPRSKSKNQKVKKEPNKQEQDEKTIEG